MFRGLRSQNKLALCPEYSKINSDFICSRCFPLARLFSFFCLISGPQSHRAGLIIRVIIPVSVTLSSSLDPSSVQKVQRPCQHPWTLVSIWEIQNRYKRVLWMWVWLPEFLCTHFTTIKEISYKDDLFHSIIFTLLNGSCLLVIRLFGSLKCKKYICSFFYY